MGSCFFPTSHARRAGLPVGRRRDAPLGLLPNGTYSPAFGVSADGAVVVGLADNAESFRVAYRWSDGVMTSLGPFPDDVLYSDALAVSADGSVIVGSMGSLSADEAYRWTDGEILGLGFLPGSSYSSANGVSANGAVIVGQSFVCCENGDDAFVWTEAGGMLRLSDVLIANGATGLEGWQLHGAWGVSSDGRWITGGAISPNGEFVAFLADISPVPEPSASWLVGSALVALACARRRVAA